MNLHDEPNTIIEAEEIRLSEFRTFLILRKYWHNMEGSFNLVNVVIDDGKQRHTSGKEHAITHQEYYDFLSEVIDTSTEQVIVKSRCFFWVNQKEQRYSDNMFNGHLFKY